MHSVHPLQTSVNTRVCVNDHGGHQDFLAAHAAARAVDRHATRARSDSYERGAFEDAHAERDRGLFESPTKSCGVDQSVLPSAMPEPSVIGGRIDFASDFVAVEQHDLFTAVPRILGRLEQFRVLLRFGGNGERSDVLVPGVDAVAVE